MKTINNKDRSIILQELQVPFDKSVVKYNEVNNTSYVPIEQYRVRLNTVVGLFNYRFQVSELQIWNSGTQQQTVSCVGTLEILYDDGEVAMSVSSPGGKNVIFVKDTGKAKDVPNDTAGASSDAFKRCCKLLGMNFDSQNARANNNNRNKNRNSNNQDSKFTVVFEKGFSSMPNGGYRANVTMDGESYSLIIWKDKIPQIESVISINELVKMCQPGKTLTFSGTKNQYNGQMQLQMTGLNKKE